MDTTKSLDLDLEIFRLKLKNPIRDRRYAVSTPYRTVPSRPST
ncbi:unnamed protein product, partial [Adineta ricciae]